MGIPHVIPYQGSKRKLAERILSHINYDVSGKVFEPFAGSAAITLAASSNKVGSEYVIGDKFSPLVELWAKIIDEPKYVAEKYSEIWHHQLEDPKNYFIKIRDEFNEDSDPVKFLYLVSRCVKNAIRFNGRGEFNQSADNRRLGTKPSRLAKELKLASSLLHGKTQTRSGDFMEILDDATPEDIIYMDPPWQGTSNKKDPRYAYVLELERFIEDLTELNDRKIPFLLSFDGTCGDKSYGKDLPSHLGLQKVGIKAGRSSQATLLGREDITVESLYLSPALIEKNILLESKTRKAQQINMFA